MSESTLVLTAAKALKLDKDLELIRALGDLAAKWQDLGPIENAPDALALLDRMTDDLDSPAIKAAFDNADLAGVYTTITKVLTAAQNTGEKVPENLRTLLKPLSAFKIGEDAADVAWTLSTSSDPVVKTDRYSLDLGAQAIIGFDAGGAWPGDAEPAKLLKINARGSARAGLKAALPFGPVSVSGQADGSASLSLDYFFAPRDDKIYGLAVANRLGALPDPFDLASAWEAFQSPALALEGLVYEFIGAASANVTVDFADAGALSAGVVDAALSVAVSAKRTSKYTLTLRRNKPVGQAGSFRATLQRGRADERTFGLELNVTADVSGLTKPVGAAIQRAVGEWDAVLTEVRPFLTPGTWLREKGFAVLKTEVGRLIDDEGLREAVLADANGALGVGTMETSAIAAWLSDQIAGAIGRGQVLINGQVDQAVARVMAGITEAVPTVAALAPVDKVQALVKAQIEKIEAALEAALLPQVATDVAKTALTAALKKAGAEIGAAVADLDDATKAVRELLNRWDALFHKILDKAKQAAEKKVTARLYRQEFRSKGYSAVVVGDFTASDPATGRVFDALTRGKLEALVQLIDGNGSAPGFDLDSEASSLSRYSRFKSEEGVEIAFISMLLQAKTLIEGEVDVEIDGQGDIHVDLKGNLNKTLRTPLNSRGVSFVDAYKLVQAAGQDPAVAGPPHLEIGVGAVFSDKSLAWDDVEDFVKNLGRANLLDPSVFARAKTTFDGWSQAGGKIAGDLSASLNFDDAALRALMRLPAAGAPDPARALTEVDRKAFIRAGFDALVQLDALNVKAFEAGVLVASDHFKPPKSPPTVEETTLNFLTRINNLMGPVGRIGQPPGPNSPAADGPVKRVSVPGADQLSLEQQRAYFYFIDQGYTLRRLVDLIATMREIYLSRARVAGPGGPGAAWGVDDYARMQAAMLHDSQEWLIVFADLLSIFKSNISRRTVAFMRALLTLSGRGPDQVGGVTLTMTCRPKAGPALTASFD